jgi:hypothetical protein
VLSAFEAECHIAALAFWIIVLTTCEAWLYLLTRLTQNPAAGKHNQINSNYAVVKMSPQITIKNDYILIEPKAGIDFREIQRGIARLFYVEDIPEQNRIWVFREGRKNLSFDDLVKLKDIIKEYYPPDARINKTALVVEPGLQTSLAESFTKIAADLPQQFRVFSNLADAEDWVKEQ